MRDGWFLCAECYRASLAKSGCGLRSTGRAAQAIACRRNEAGNRNVGSQIFWLSDLRSVSVVLLVLLRQDESACVSDLG